MNEELVTYYKPKSIVSESIKTIRTNLLFTSIDMGLKTVLVTSSVPGEGKSFVAANLASAFAQSKYSVLLIDCDLRKGRLHKLLGMKNEKGLSDMLIVKSLVDQSYINKTTVPNLDFLSMGTVPPNPLELLSSSKFSYFLKIFKENYDIIVIDSPPVGIVSDALVLSKLVDETVIVSAHHKTNISDLQNTKKSIQNAGGKIAGVVLNKKKTNKKEYYDKYYQQ